VWPDRNAERGDWRRWLAIGVSLAVHSLLFLVVIHGYLPEVPGRDSAFIAIPAVPDVERTTPTRYYIPLVEQGRGTRRAPVPPVNPVPTDSVVAPEPQTIAREPDESASTVRRSPAGRIGPALGDGRLWVRPLPVPPKELAERLGKTHVELVDSAVTAIVQGYLDSIAREPGADQVRLPDWTATVAGKKFGLDSRNIYIAGLKIPAAVLALLPIPSGGNQQRALDHTGAWIGEDLRRAAQRATTLDEFKRAVKDLRLEKQRQKDLERAQRELPDSTK
jgi:hypothetical protein